MANEKMQQILNHLETVKTEDVLSFTPTEMTYFWKLNQKLQVLLDHLGTMGAFKLDNLAFPAEYVKDYTGKPSLKVHPPKAPEIELRKENGKRVSTE